MQGLEINPKHDLVSSILQDNLVKGVVAGRTGEREDVMINNDLELMKNAYYAIYSSL